MPEAPYKLSRLSRRVSPSSTDRLTVNSWGGFRITSGEPVRTWRTLPTRRFTAGEPVAQKRSCAFDITTLAQERDRRLGVVLLGAIVMQTCGRMFR